MKVFKKYKKSIMCIVVCIRLVCRTHSGRVGTQRVTLVAVCTKKIS